jgi:hypothetical protein
MDVSNNEQLAQKVNELILEGMEEHTETGEFPASDLWARVSACGSELWLDTGDMGASRPL